MSPNLNPSRMPCLTQVLTRQPTGARLVGLGGAHRPGRERFAQLREDRARRVAIGRRSGRDELVDFVFQHVFARSTRARL